MSDDVVTVPADDLHAFLAVFARIAHLASSPALPNLRDAIAEQDRTRAQLFALNANLPAILDALDFRIASMKTEATKRPYRDALTALGYAEVQERSDEEETR